jgi:glycosyltransferase involved in cell wall biosynthesis
LKILFLPKYFEEGPSSRYRTFNYLVYFKKQGYDLNVKPLFYNGYVRDLYNNKKSFFKILSSYIKRFIFLVTNKKKYDLLIIEKELFPFIPYFFEKMLLGNTSYTLDYDDAISAKYKNMKLFKFFYNQKINKLSKKSLFTTVGNYWYFKEIESNNLKYLPTVIDINNYKLQKLKTKNSLKPIIVWIGTPSTVKYLEILKDVFRKLSKEYDFILRVIGADYNISGVNVENLEWNKEKEFLYLVNSDIGIMPLYNEYWEYGKCGFKIIQYMASGLPVIATPLPANKEIIINNKTGFLATDEEQWYFYLKKMLKDKNLRKTMGVNSRKRIEEKYTYQIWNKKYLEYIDEFNK